MAMNKSSKSLHNTHRNMGKEHISVNNVSVETIKCAQQGDAKAFQELYDMCYQHVYSYALKLSHNEADAKDIVQETFLQVFQSIADLQKPEYFPLWLNRIVFSKFHRMLSKRKETAIEQSVLQFHVDQSDEVKIMNDTYVLDDEEILLAMIEGLSEKQRNVIKMMYYDQFTISEIAAILHLPEGTVKSRIAEAKKSLRKQVMEFEKREQRKLEFHADALLPMAALSIFAKLKDFFTRFSMTQKMLAVSALSMVVVSTTAVVQTLPYLQNLHNEAAEIVLRQKFQPVIYQNETIDNAKSAYYTLMKWAPDAEHVKKKTKQEKEAIRPLMEELRSIDSPYYHLLWKDRWMEAYNE